MVNILFSIVIAAIIGAACLYIRKSSKKGIRCVGCPYANGCSGEKSCSGSKTEGQKQ